MVELPEDMDDPNSPKMGNPMYRRRGIHKHMTELPEDELNELSNLSEADACSYVLVPAPACRLGVVRGRMALHWLRA